MVQAVSNGVGLAPSNRTVIVEGNHYLPEASVKREYLRPSETNTAGRSKGVRVEP
jgi:uncharacterized protein (DUF427 family)